MGDNGGILCNGIRTGCKNKMTDRFFAVTVLLEKDTREDDAQAILEAISMIKGVASASPHIADLGQWAAEERARHEIRDKLWKVLYSND